MKLDRLCRGAGRGWREVPRTGVPPEHPKIPDDYDPRKVGELFLEDLARIATIAEFGHRSQHRSPSRPLSRSPAARRED